MQLHDDFLLCLQEGGSTDGAMTLISGWASVLPLANGLSSDVLFFD
jgi:hypothetical protein